MKVMESTQKKKDRSDDNGVEAVRKVRKERTASSLLKMQLFVNVTSRRSACCNCRLCEK